MAKILRPFFINKGAEEMAEKVADVCEGRLEDIDKFRILENLLYCFYILNMRSRPGVLREIVALEPQAMAPPPLCGGALEILQGGWRPGQFGLAWVDQGHPQPIDFRVPLGSTA